MLALDTPLAGLPTELPAHLAAELTELIDDAERYTAAAQAVCTRMPSACRSPAAAS